MEKLLRKGAEASIYLGKWFGEDAVFKIRERKKFRISQLDEKIRTMRTIREATFLSAAKKLGVSTPLIYFINRNKSEIIMQFIQGQQLKGIIDSRDKHFLKKCKLAGKYIAYLHSGNIIHGDLTTANFICCSDNLVLLDFGLSFYSQRLEDKAIDLHLLKMIVDSSHINDADKIFDAVLIGYSSVVGKNTNNILSRMKNIELRGRYK